MGQANPHLKILIVDDDEPFRKVLAAMFRGRANVTAVGSGKEAIEKIGAEKFDLVFSDVCMANGTGIELLDWVQENHIGLPVVLITGETFVLGVDEAINRGARSVIFKPFRIKEVLDVISHCLGG